MPKIGQKIHRYEVVSSTNTLAKRLAAKGEEEGTVVIAETQRKGKGRLGRVWESPKGGLWFSLILRPKTHPSKLPLITFVSSVAVAKALQEMFGLKVQVKWPNDVLIGNKKVCGILTEANTKGDVVNFVVVGIGINANIDLHSFSPDLRGSATSLKTELQKTVDEGQLLQLVFEKLEYYYGLFQKGKYDALLAEWKKLAAFLGKPVEVVSLDEKFVGKAVDVDENGALIIRLGDGSLRKIFSGDITIKFSFVSSILRLPACLLGLFPFHSVFS